MTTDLQSEAEKMQRVSGIAFVDGPAGRRACIVGTGLDVFEVIGAFACLTGGWEELRRTFQWLTEDQLRAAFTYYQAYPAEIDDRLQREADWTEERVWSIYPSTRPH